MCHYVLLCVNVVLSHFVSLCVVMVFFYTGLASINKNYILHEASTMTLSIYIKNIELLSKIGTFQPKEHNIINDMSTYLNNIHVDYDDDIPTIYDVPNCSIFELRGVGKRIDLSSTEMNSLLIEAMEYMEEGNLLHLIKQTYESFCRRFPKKYKNNIIGYLSYIFDDKNQSSELESITSAILSCDSSTRKLYENDLKFVKDFIKDKDYCIMWVTMMISYFFIIFILTLVTVSFIRSIHDNALIKSIEFTTIFEEDSRNYPTYKEMSENIRKKQHKIPFCSVPYNVGSTSHHNPVNRDKYKHSFGCPRYFFRFDFTSAISSVPYAYVTWCRFSATSFYRTCFMGRFTQDEWQTGPKHRTSLCPFVTVDDIIPSRFVLAFRDNLDAAFICLDPERVGVVNDDGTFILQILVII